MEPIKERLANKYKKATDALKTLKESYTDLQNIDSFARCTDKDPQKIYRTYRDSMIQRFEYTFDTTWKYLGEYLQSEGRTLEPKTPKAIFRESLKAGLVSEAGARSALAMVDHRNLTTHGYDEELIEEISKHIPEYIKLLEAVLKQTQK